MTKEQQDLLWACLPKEARDYIRKQYYSLGYLIVNDKSDIAPHKATLLEDIFGEHNLTSKAEPEGTMEEKELNLCELLKGCEGERFYLLSRGYTTLKEIIWNKDTCDYSIVLTGKGRIELYSSGKEVNNEAAVILYPSKELYKKYPLDAYSAWMEWQEERKPKRWRAEYGETYYSLRDSFTVCDQYENNDSDNDCAWSNYNYFRTPQLAEQAAKEVKECLMKFHEKNSEE